MKTTLKAALIIVIAATTFACKNSSRDTNADGSENTTTPNENTAPASEYDMQTDTTATGSGRDRHGTDTDAGGNGNRIDKETDSHSETGGTQNGNTTATP